MENNTDFPPKADPPMVENTDTKKIQNPALIAGAILLAGLLVAGSILLKGNAPERSAAPQNNVPVFTACLESGKYTQKVEGDIRDGNNMGVQGTPSSFILVNGKIVDTIPGALDYDTVINKIEEALKSDGGAGRVMPGRPLSPEDHIIGSLNAKVIVLEYSDLECPFCKMFHSTMHRAVESNRDVAWIYRHYPIPQLHLKAAKEAEATECAWEQGGNEAFWKFTDRIFQITPSNDRLDSLELPKIAEYIGLD